MATDSWQQDVPESYRALTRELAASLAPDITLEGVLGVGGMGAVLVGREVALDRRVAVKLLSPALAGDPVAHARFVREAQAAAAVQHPHVVPIFRVGELPTSHAPYFVMQHVPGHTLEAAFPGGTPASVPDVQRIVGQVASALAAAHAKGLVHRDIKTANILLDHDGRRAIVVDFGISASRAAAPGDDRLTQQGQTLGTPRYMSPEVAAGEPAVPASDVYSLGCVAYELLAGRPVFDAATPQGVIAKHLRDAPDPLLTLRRELPAELVAMVERCLSKDPAARPSAAAIANALMPEELAFEWPPPGMRRVHGWLARTAPWFAVATVLFGTPILIGLGVGVDSALTATPRIVGVALLLLLPVIVFIVGTGVATGPLFAALRAGRDVGYSSFTVLEVLADPGDGARLIAGVREYAALTVAQRQRLRTLRVIRPLLLVATAPLSIIALPVGWIALPRLGGSIGDFAWLGLAAFLVPVIAWKFLGIPAGAHLPRQPHRRTQLVERLPAEARRWRAGVAQAIIDNPQLRAEPVPRWMQMSVEYGVAVAMVVTTSLLVYLAIALTFGAIGRSGRLSYHSDRLEELLQWRAVPAAIRAPVDATITEAEAGRLAYRLFIPTEARFRRYLVPADTWPAFTMFADDSLRRAFGLASGSTDVWEQVIARVAATRITAAERSFLERGAAHPAGAAFARLAHARSMDLYAVVLGSPAYVAWALWAWRPTTTAINVSQPRFAAAALLAANGKPDEAAAVVREVISVGALLMEDGRRHADFRAGISRVRRGVSVLRVLAARSGSGVDASAFGDGPPSASELLAASRRGSAAPDVDSAAAIMRRVANGRSFLALRFAALNGLRLAQCSAPVRALFAESSDDRAAFATVESSLTRASDRALLIWVRDTLGRAHLPSLPTSNARVLPEGLFQPGSASRTVGRALGMLGWSSRGGACLLISDNGTFW